MKGAIVGFGNIAENSHLPAFEKLGIDIAACVDISEERRKKAEKLGIKSFSSLRDMNAGTVGIDFIDITTPPSFRYGPIKFAVENSLDVLCEKPLALPGEVEKVKRLAESSGVFIFPIHNWKNAPQYKKARAVAMENDVNKIKIKVLRTSHAKGCSAWNPDWRKKIKFSGGGIIMDHGYHNIYLAMFLLGAEPEEFENAELTRIKYFEDEEKTENKAEFKLLFENGKEAEIRLDWCADKREVSCTGYKGSETSFTLEEDKILAEDKEHVFDKKLSGNSLHSDWTCKSIEEFMKKRTAKSKKYLLEGTKVVEIIKVLYAKASLLR